MGLKFFAVALVALLSVQGLNAKSLNIEDPKARAVKEEMYKLVQEAKINVEQTIVEGIAEVKQAFDEITTISQQNLNKAMSDIQQLKEATIADIKQFEKVSAKLGFSIEECVEEQMPRINDLVAKTQQNCAECVASLLAEFQNMYENLLAVCSAAYDRIFILVGELFECTDVGCYLGVGQKIIQEMNTISAQVRNTVDESIYLMQQQMPAAAKCLQGQIVTFKEELAVIVADIKACIAAGNN